MDADKRTQNYSFPVERSNETNSASQAQAPVGPLWRHGTPPSSEFLAAPYPTTMDSSDEQFVECVDLDICAYGSVYEPKSCKRVCMDGDSEPDDQNIRGVSDRPMNPYRK